MAVDSKLFSPSIPLNVFWGEEVLKYWNIIYILIDTECRCGFSSRLFAKLVFGKPRNAQNKSGVCGGGGGGGPKIKVAQCILKHNLVLELLKIEKNCRWPQPTHNTPIQTDTTVTRLVAPPLRDGATENWLKNGDKNNVCQHYNIGGCIGDKLNFVIYEQTFS